MKSVAQESSLLLGGAFTPSWCYISKGTVVILWCIRGYKSSRSWDSPHTRSKECRLLKYWQVRNHFHPHLSPPLDRQSTFKPPLTAWHGHVESGSIILKQRWWGWKCHRGQKLAAPLDTRLQLGLSSPSQSWHGCAVFEHFLADKQIPSVIITKRSPQTELEEKWANSKNDVRPVKSRRRAPVHRLHDLKQVFYIFRLPNEVLFEKKGDNSLRHLATWKSSQVLCKDRSKNISSLQKDLQRNRRELYCTTENWF